jgi:putative SOS response-associated peptidase YedK
MCGRYRLTAKERYLRDHFGLEGDVSWEPRWNIAPTQQVPVVRQDRKEPKRTFALLRWGLIPHWGQGRVHWVQDRQCNVGGCCGETRLP